MNQFDKNQTESQLISLVDNLDIKIDIQDDEYIILLKKQPQKSYSTLYLTDCQQNYWLRKIDLNFIEQLKQTMKLKTSTQTFIKCLMKSLSENIQIQVTSEKIQLQVKLQIGEGLTMTCFIDFSAKINKDKDQKGYKIISKLFIRQLYQSKQSKQKSLKQEINTLRAKKQSQNQEQVGKKDPKFISEVLGLSQQKKQPTKNLKNRDLLNPNKQKRKHAGIKLGTPF